jgi:lysophospholipase L1-like esterase
MRPTWGSKLYRGLTEFTRVLHRQNVRQAGEMEQLHPWTRYVAIGDSFTEGIGDPEAASPGGNRGWADRVAEVLGQNTPDFAYANLAIRGRLLNQVHTEQLEPALALTPGYGTLNWPHL